MRSVEDVNIYRRILGVVLLNIQLQSCRWFLGIDSSCHFVCSFGEHGEHAVVYVVVNEDDACGSFVYAVVDKSISIEDLTIVEDALVRVYITAIQTTKDLFEFVVCFCLMSSKCQLVLCHHIQSLEYLCSSDSISSNEQSLNATEVFTTVLAGKELRAGDLRAQVKQRFQIRNDDTFKRLFAIAQSDGLIVRRQVSEREVYYSLATPPINDEPELF